jgi:glycosyltransferase involved in cell wall biosynthesis
LAKYVGGQSQYLRLDYWKSLQDMCKRADAVICTTDEQKQDILQFCQNVHIILDIHSTVSRSVKTDYCTGEVFNFVWEGLPQNIVSFYEIKDVLDYLKQNYNVALHVVTDLEYRQYLRKYHKRQTVDIARKIFDNVYLYEWNEATCSAIFSACDMALIPLSLTDPLYKGKPENKLLLFWRMGIPVVTSATPAYTRAMEGCGLPMACRTSDDWIRILEHYMSDKEARRDAGQRGLSYTNEHYSEESTLKRWDDVFASLL